jgi:DNA adenine methylase
MSAAPSEDLAERVRNAGSTAADAQALREAVSLAPDPENEPAVRRPALRYHGAKFRLARWVISYFPPHECYVEPFGGAAGVLLQKPRSYAEVYNDLDGDVVNFFKVLRDPGLRSRLEQLLLCTPYSRAEFELAWGVLDTDDEQSAELAVERARRTAIRAQMGFGAAGATQGSTGLRTDTKRRYTTAQHDWLSYPAAVAAAGVRFAGVLIENRPAVHVMREHDGPNTLHYVDPPYLHSTRVMRGRGAYRHEMSDGDHFQLIQALCDLEGMVLLCGYENEVYADALAGWARRAKLARISAGRGTTTRTEVMWMNPACAAALARESGPLFGSCSTG